MKKSKLIKITEEHGNIKTNPKEIQGVIREYLKSIFKKYKTKGQISRCIQITKVESVKGQQIKHTHKKKKDKETGRKKFQ